jgi:hypothetical protein
MVTTNSFIPIDAFGSDPDGLIHLTGWFQVLARVALRKPDALSAHVELCFDAAQVRGVSLETGARYQARGAYRFIHDPRELPVDLDLVSTFELFCYGRENPPPTRLLLVVPFQVTVPADGRITTCLAAPKLLACPGG